MNPGMQAVLNTLELDDKFFLNGVATLDDDTVSRRVVDNTNAILWLAGHLLNSRKYLLDLFGDVRELAWEQKFREKYDPSVEYPSMAELKDAWVSVSQSLISRMKEASDDHFTKAIDWDLPNGDKTVRGACLFYAYHEAWHLGQIAYARRGMGMEGLVPY
jgi:uncharacterized damage-inducible protein DinB